jgi:hypothetical protein
MKLRCNRCGKTICNLVGWCVLKPGDKLTCPKCGTIWTVEITTRPVGHNICIRPNSEAVASDGNWPVSWRQSRILISRCQTLTQGLR